jgi:tRNA(fMet)-specific endonuclease VapC
MLDTDTVSFALRGEGAVADRLLEHRPSEVCVSAITVAELRYGADHRRSRKLHRLIDAFTAALTVAPFDQAAATSFGRVAATLARRGTPIGQLDALIGAHAVALGLTLVTNDVKHLGRVPGLRTTTWLR